MFLMVENDPNCPPGACLQLLSSSGQPFRIVAGYRGEAFPDPAELTGLIVLGGEMGVYETRRFPHLDRVRAYMEAALVSAIPLLGICLGGQLLAQLAGGEVSSPSRHGERGICQVNLTPQGRRDPLFSGVPNPFLSFQLHEDSFSAPPGATLLAESTACPAQAFRLDSGVYGVQFHPEVDRSIVACWEQLAQPTSELLSGFDSAHDAFVAASHAILANFISLAATSRTP